MKVTVMTQAYNAEGYISRCIESVLNQTLSDFQYIVIDNGSTDNTGEIIRQYAADDARIEFIQFEQNGRGRWNKQIAEKTDSGDYFTLLDADDWLESDYLERLVSLAEITNTDMVITGSTMHFEKTNQVSKREASQRLVLDRNDYAKAFPFYHAFLRPVWGKIVRTNIVKDVPYSIIVESGVCYGTDTLLSFAWLRKAERICLDNSVLHHYRIHQKSVSHKYDPRQSYSDIYLFNDAVSFLSDYGPVSRQNMEFLYCVYANALKDTANNLVNSTLPPADKMHEYNKMLLRQVTKSAYSENNETVVSSKRFLLACVIICASELTEENDELSAIMSALLPKCGAAFTVKSARLFRFEKDPAEALVNDDKPALVKSLLKLVGKGSYSEQYDIPKMLRELSRDNPVLCEISDKSFLRKYGDLYAMIAAEDYAAALDKMTDILLGGSLPGETFLSVYLSLAAGLECADEFIFGKIKLAMFYVNEKRFDECRTVLGELSEMGVEDNEDVTEIKRKLNL